jgi:hypothetical protein
MKPFTSICAVALLFIAACSGSRPPEACAENTSAVCSSSGTKPDVAKTRAHLATHVTYPAKRADILAACAETPEFTAAEKEWLASNLPDGNYASADEVARALRL